MRIACPTCRTCHSAASALLLQPFAESARLVGERLVGCGAGEKPANPADAVWSGSLLNQAPLQQELTELLKRWLQISHAPLLGTTERAAGTGATRSRRTTSAAFHDSPGSLDRRAREWPHAAEPRLPPG